MKVLYLTVPSFFDLEISLIRELKKLVDIKVVMIVSPESMHSSAFSIDKLDERCAIIPATQYNGMEQYKDMLNLDDWYIANNPDNSWGHSISLARQIASFCKQGKYDLLHSTTDCKTAVMLLPFSWRFKHTLFTEHDPISHKKLSFVNDLLRYRLMFKAFKNLLFMSDALLEPFCKKYHHDRSKIHFSRLSVYDFLNTYRDSGNRYGDYMLFFGRITPYKGVDILIDAYLQSEACKQGCKLVIAGKGDIEHATTSLPDNIILLNKYITNEDLSNLIRHCKFVVLPYISATQSGCVMSAFAFNKPIIATRVGDLPKEVVDGETGIICNPNDVDSLKGAINNLYNDDLAKYANNIESRYKNGGPYSWEAAAESTVNAYKEVLK